MKQINLSAALRTIVAASVAILAVSCDEPKTPEGEGPSGKLEIADIKDAKPGEPQSVTFKATAVWTISSDKQWCTPDKATGQAGDNTVSFTITDAEQVFDVNDVATISIFYGKESVGSFTIERAAKERVMVFEVEKTDGEEAVWEKTEVMTFASTGGSSFRGKIRVSANFNWLLSSVPAWIDIDSATPNNSGEADAEPAIMWLDCITAQLETGAMTGEIAFKDTDAGKDVYKLKAEFAGTGEDFLYLEAADQVVTFTAEGKVVDGGADFYPATLYGSEYGFIPLIFENGYFGGQDENYEPIYVADWVHITPVTEKAALGSSNLKITVDEAGTKSREAWIMLLPKAKYDEVKDDPSKLINSEGKELLPEYEANYVLAVKQNAKEPIKFAEGYPEGTKWVYKPAANFWEPGQYLLTIPAFSADQTTISFTVPGSKTERPGMVAEMQGTADWVTVATVTQDNEDSDIITLTINKNTNKDVRSADCNLIEEGQPFIIMTIDQQPAN